MEEHFHRLEIDIRKRGEQAQTMEAEMKKMTELMQKILKCVQDRQTGPHKPDILPVTNFEQMQAFEEATEEHYTDAVHFFHYIGGFNLKEAVRLCLKEALDDFMATSYIWFGREKGRRPLFNTRLVKAIYDGVCKNNNFGRPQRSEFQRQMQESLRVMKERNRMRIRRHRRNPAGRNENLWDDEELEDIADTDATNDIQQ
ncbi:uncharacterized protein LOC116850183 isoform X2 [Odontomachus brunneus]|uniref:uncharacterized protein LOC116850183 isoform X2 n=1 Tax=Odontomachus brunneus TaxID=486640 RepID=UPI0013F185CB|nr:uncharacterized protein LOC116850183 isoform X2 [Odontomachus brunneus]